MSDSTNWTFTSLANNQKGVSIGKCQGWLPNKMQCTRAAQYQATDNSTNPPTQAGQYCQAHMLHLQAGVAIAPIKIVAGTGTVEAQPVPTELFEIKTPDGKTEKLELVPDIEGSSSAEPNTIVEEKKEENGGTGISNNDTSNGKS